ncbi:tail protein [Catellatospora sp. TT07R-123]|uniref:phage tail protein n=1 Tax=Catellatospora sp. TT07R-123 TaxID=2733863 RepID=UPI001B2374F3|nr:phage tail protein [Catellatospora sp. TT07R-123]GHJ45273.1 tail protein [Catellatospora sp. TT07R-123]
MRGTVSGLLSPYPMGERLPSVYLVDEMAQGLTAACDEVLAPVLSVLDNLPAYFDPLLAPPDFLRWLGSWVSTHPSTLPSGAVDERWRGAIAAAGGTLRRIGTAAAIAAEVAVAAGVPVEDVDVADSGGVSWSTDPAAPLPGQDVPKLAVRIRAPDPALVDQHVVAVALAAAKPAHLPCTLTVA